MMYYSLSLVASSIGIFIAFMECNATETAKVQANIQSNSLIIEAISESEKDLGVAYIVMPESEIVENPETLNIDKPTVLMSDDFSFKSMKATVNGTSTLHDWESKVTKMEGKGSFQLKDNVLASINDAEIKIAVHGIISKEGRKMDNKTYETFKSDEYPYIIYSFSNAVVKINDAQIVSIEATGNLTMAGENKSVSLLANGKELPNGDLQLSVSKKIKMTDYNMKPPVMFLGTIRVGDEITVSFDFVLSKMNK